MSALSKKQLRTPMSGENIDALRARLERITSAQGSAANLTHTEVSIAAGNLREITFVAAATPASGESLAVAVTVDGDDVLGTAFTYDDTLEGGTVYKLDVDRDVNIQPGAVIVITRTYVAGGGPTPIGANKVVLEYA